MKKHVLEVDGIRKEFNGKTILSDVYLKCETSEIVGLIGRNGSGKSTLLKIISNMLPSPDKCVRVDFISVKKRNALQNEICYLSQEHFIPKHLTVRRAIELSVDEQNRSFFNNDELIISVLNKKIKHLSGGEFRYLEVKLVLYNPSKFVLLDEPFSRLSPLSCEKIILLIKENALKKGIIITDHNHENVILVATRLISLENGRVSKVTEKDVLSVS